MIIVSIVQAITFYIIATTNEILAHRVTTDMTADLFTSLQKRPLQYHDQIRIGDVMARSTGDTRIINIGLSPAFRIFGQIITAIVFSSVILFTINVELTLILFLSAPLYGYFLYRFGKTLEPMSKEVQEVFGELSVHTAETMQGIRELKSYNAERYACEEFNSFTTNHSDKMRRVGVTAAWYYPGLLQVVVLGLTTVLGIYFVTQGRISIPELVAYIGLISTINWIGRNLHWSAEYVAKTNAATKRVRDMIIEESIEPDSGTSVFTGDNTIIELQNVSFRFQSDRDWALEGVTLTINHGDTVAIVGGPGSGKSTFNKLLLRLYEPTSGEIRVGGKKLSEYTNKSLRDQISVIEQDVFLFSDTVRSNIAFGKPQVVETEVNHAAKLAAADEFIDLFEDGYETQIGERGVRLSGGQKQRIAIARALVMDPAILIMDDASSALDAETEEKIQNAIRNVLKTRTSIVTTHRLAVIAEANKVLVFDKGKIVAEGTHDYLIRSSLYYRRLFENHYELPPLIVKSNPGTREGV
jgi:ATP-binding cassette subfamily B protein